LTYILAIPIFNEEHNIKKLIDTINNSFLKNDSSCTKIVLVNDGSIDRSKSIINSCIKKKDKILLLNHKINKGYGAALRTAIRYSKNKSDYIIFADSDLTNPLNDIKKIKRFMKKKIDYIQGDRLSAGLDLLPLERKIFTLFGNIIAKLLMNMNLNDYTGGYRAVKVLLYNKIVLKENDFSIIMEEKYKLKDKIYSIRQFKTKIHVRSDDLRKTSFNYRLPLLIKYLMYCLKTIFVKRNF
jgi:glycosyltransferase involved in cell wall biosynthesis|tara:strand:+ start:177 stop:896 length:720 start_codon:yes stop_codon:yes gene_type:complete